MAKKRVNKNLVAFLTVMGILLSVGVVAVATRKGAQKDPEFWAARARDFEAARDYELAIQMFDRAYRASRAPGGGRNVAWLAEAARCAWQYGELGLAFGTLQRAHSEQRDNERVLLAYLGHIWELIHEFDSVPQVDAHELLEYAQDLQSVDAKNPLGPTTEALACWILEAEDPANRAKGDEAFARALALDANHPAVVWTRLKSEGRKAYEQRTELEARRAARTQIEAIDKQFADNRLAYLKAGVEANPGSWWLVNRYVAELNEQKQYDQARAVLEKAAAERPEDAIIQMGLARFLQAEAYRRRAEFSPEEYAQALDQARTHAQKARDLEPAMYDAYGLLAELALTSGPVDSDRPGREQFEAALAIYHEGIERTVGLRSYRATLGAQSRMYLYGRAFTCALAHYYGATDEADRQQRLARLKEEFLQPTMVRYPEDPFTAYMRGQVAICEQDVIAAIQHFEQAQAASRTDTFRAMYPAMWFRVFNGVLPVDRLALLYREHRQTGEALRYIDQAIAEYESKELADYRRGQPAPLRLVLARAEVLNQLQRFQEALDYAAELRTKYADELASGETEMLRLAAIRAEALRNLGQMGQSVAELEKVQAQTADIRGLLLQISLASMEKDYETVITLGEQAVQREDFPPAMLTNLLRMLIPAYSELGRNEEGKKLVAGLRARFKPEGSTARVFDQYEIWLTYTDQAQRDAKLLELIMAEPDPFDRGSLQYSFQVQRDQFAEAAKTLTQLEQLRPEEPWVLEQQFRMALRDKQYDRAGEYVMRLSRLREGQGADGAGGAMYRGDLAMAQEKWEEAVREYRTARGKLPRSSELQVRLGRAMLNAQHFPEAADALRDAVQLNPQDGDAHLLLYLAYQELPIEQRPPDDGDSHILEAARLMPNDPRIQSLSDLIEEKRDPEAAITKREEMLAKDPRDMGTLVRLVQLHASLAERYEREKDQVRTAQARQKAGERLQQGLKLDPSDELLARVAMATYARGQQRQEGEEHLRLFLESQTGMARGKAQMMLAAFQAQFRDVTAAERGYRDAMRTFEETVEDPVERRQLVLSAGLGLIELYRQNPGREAQVIDAGRWLLSKLDPKQTGDVDKIRWIRRSVIQAMLARRLLGDAERECETYLRDYPGDLDGLLVRAQLKLAGREWDAAFEVLSRILEQVPESAWCLLNRGQLLGRRGEYVKAREDLLLAKKLCTEARQRAPDSQDARLLYLVSDELAKIYEVTNDYLTAEGELRFLLELAAADPQGAARTQQLADRLVTLQRRANQLDKAKQQVSEFMNRFSDSPLWPFRFATVCTDQAELLTRQAEAARAQGDTNGERRARDEARAQYNNAVSYFERGEQLARGRSPEFAATCFAYRLEALASAGQAAKALQLYEDLAKGEPLPTIVHAAVIKAYLDAGRREQALACLEQALKTAMYADAATVRGAVGIARKYLSSEQLISVLQKLVEQTPEGTPEGLRLRSTLAVQYTQAGQVEEGLQLSQRVLAKAQAGSPEWGDAMSVQAQALQRKGDVAGAAEAYRQVIERFPTEASALNNLAFLLADEANRPAEALPYAEEARQLEPRNPSYLDTLGWVYFKSGRYSEAEAHLKEALSIAADDAVTHYHLGLLYADRGRLAEARPALQRAAELAARDKDSDFEQKVNRALAQLQ